jgi:hypothetical protein
MIYLSTELNKCLISSVADYRSITTTTTTTTTTTKSANVYDGMCGIPWGDCGVFLEKNKEKSNTAPFFWLLAGCLPAVFFLVFRPFLQKLFPYYKTYKSLMACQSGK